MKPKYKIDVSKNSGSFAVYRWERKRLFMGWVQKDYFTRLAEAKAYIERLMDLPLYYGDRTDD